MAIATSTVLGIVGAATAVYGAAEQASARRDAKAAAEQSSRKSDQIRAEQKAAQMGQAAQEQRQQIREERVRRARIIQSAENSGASESSGELGALGVLSTNLSTNLGLNAGSIARGERVSGLAQGVADSNFQIQSSSSRAANMGQLAGFGASIFNASGGFSTIMPSPPGTVDNSIFGTAGSGNRSVAD